MDRFFFYAIRGLNDQKREKRDTLLPFTTRSRAQSSMGGGHETAGVYLCERARVRVCVCVWLLLVSKNTMVVKVGL